MTYELDYLIIEFLSQIASVSGCLGLWDTKKMLPTIRGCMEHKEEDVASNKAIREGTKKKHICFIAHNPCSTRTILTKYPSLMKNM